MAFRPSSRTTTMSAFTDTVVSKKGSGAQVILGLVIILVGIGVGQAAVKNPSITYISAAIGVSIIISSFLIIIRQYERG